MSSSKFARGVVLSAACLFVFAVMVGSASADLLVHEPFAYEDGWLTGQGGALGTTGTWTANDTHNGDWRIHQEGDSANIVIDATPTFNTFDGTVANLATIGGYVGLPGPDDTGADPNLDHEIGRNMDASIGLDPSVTATFQSGTTTWFSYLAVRAWDRNVHVPGLIIGTDPTPNESRAASLTNSGNGIGVGGGPPRNDRFAIHPTYYDGGVPGNLNGLWNGDWRNDAWGTPADGRIPWVASDDDGFGAANIVVGKIEWDADTGGEDIISVGSFLETDTIDEAAFDAQMAAQPNLSSANWAVAANKPNLDQTQFDLINVAGLKFFIDEIRIATTFAEVTPSTLFDPTDFDQDGDTDLTDVNLLTAEADLAAGLAVPLADAKFDLSGDSVVGSADLDQWLTDAATINGFGSPYLKGDTNLDGDVDVWAFDGSGDAQVLSENLGTMTGMVWGDGDFNGDGDVDVWAFDGSGDAQQLSSNLGSSSDAAEGTAEAIYNALTGELSFDVGEGVGVIGVQAAGMKHGDVDTGSPLGAPGQNGGNVLAYFSASGLAAGMSSVGVVLPTGLTAGDIDFAYTPLGGNTTAAAVTVIVPEPSTIAMLLVVGAMGLCRRRRRA